MYTNQSTGNIPLILVQYGDVDASQNNFEVDVVFLRQEVLHLVELRFPPHHVLLEVTRLDLNLRVITLYPATRCLMS